MITDKTLDGKILKEGNLRIGEGEEGMRMFDDTMALALRKTAKTSYILRTAVLTIATAIVAGLAYHFDNIYAGGAAGALGTLALQQGKETLEASGYYAEALEEAISHGWATESELRKIDRRYL